MTARLLATLLFVVCLGLPAQGLGQSDLMPGPTATIASVVDGDTVVLKTPVLGGLPDTSRRNPSAEAYPRPQEFPDLAAGRRGKITAGGAGKRETADAVIRRRQ